MVGIALDPANGGYWEVGSDGQVYDFGGAPKLGSPGPRPSPAPSWALPVLPPARGTGRWAATVRSTPTARAGFHGAASGQTLNAPVGGMAVDSSTGGYWLFSMDGGTFAFGAPFDGAG